MAEVTTQTLTDFLLSRITEDEAGAADIHHRYECSLNALMAYGDCSCERPARVRAECEAKRRIVELHPLVVGADVGIPGDLTGCQTCHVLDRVHEDAIVEALGPCDTLCALALPYADHPDFRDEWRP